MAIQLSVAVRNARLDAIEATIGTGPTLEIRTGAMPANCAAADAGTLLAAMTLPSDWMAAASGGAKDKAGTWQDSAANAVGMAGYFRVKADTTCHMQGLASQAWAASSPYSLNQQVNNGGLVYKCVTAGTSAGSGGPTGTGTGITDGTCEWDYVGTANLIMDNSSIAVGQSVTVSGLTLTDGNA